MYLPWNNPLVGTAFMLRARRSNMLLNFSIYIIILVMALSAWQYYVAISPKMATNPNKLFLMMLFGGQCFLSGIIMLGQAGGCLKNEVMNKTLDFQRIAAIGPWDILLGKLLGVPVMAYLLAMASIPIGVFALLNGVNGVSLIALFLTWLQLLTFLFLVGACAIQNTLHITTAKGTGASPGFGIFMACMGILIYSTFGPGDSVTFLADPRRSTFSALFTPLTAFAGISAENPWLAQFSWFGFDIPCLFFTPIAHIVIAVFVLSIMARRLENVENTPLGKKNAYLMLILCDLVLAGVLYSCGRNGKLGAAGLSQAQQVGLFLITHVLLSLVYYVTLTPRSDLVMTWIWRFQTPGHYLRDSFWHDRAPNTMAVLVNVLSAALGVGLLCLTNAEGFAEPDLLVDVSLTAGATVIFLGLLYQAVHLISRKYGSAYFLLIVIFLIVGPSLIGSMLSQTQIPEYRMVSQGLLYCSPITQLLRFTMPHERGFVDIVPYPMVAAYLVFSFFLLIYTFNWLKTRTGRVETTKARLLTPPTALATP